MKKEKLKKSWSKWLKVAKVLAVIYVVLVLGYIALNKDLTIWRAARKWTLPITPRNYLSNEYYDLKISLVADRVLNSYVGLIDFDGDGDLEILAASSSQEKLPIEILEMQENGNLALVTSKYIKNEGPGMYQPIGEVADYNGDGYDDIIIIDGGNGDRFHGGFIGGEPTIILSDGKGMWAHSEVLIDEIMRAKAALGLGDNEIDNGRALHAKSLAAGDIDNDGDIDIHIESGGGADGFDPFFLINQSSEIGELDFIVKTHMTHPEFLEQGAVYGLPLFESTWRFGSNMLYDFDGDGYSDWIKVQLRAGPLDLQQTSNYHQFIMNDKGVFRPEGIHKLPWPDWEDGYTYARDIAVGDVTGDDLPDIVIIQDRSNKIEPCCTGRYVQILENMGMVDSVPEFTDATNRLMPDQSATTGTREQELSNQAHSIEVQDFNGDGLNDIIMTLQLGYPVDEQSPLVYMNEGDGFSVVPKEVFTMGKRDFGFNPYSVDLNDDGLLDFIFMDEYWNKTIIYTTISKKAYLPD